MAKNKPWTRDELILALDLYFRLEPRQNSTDEPAVQELSRLLAAIPPLENEARQDNYRSPGSITMKMGNLQYLDPERPGGLKAGGKLDLEVWEEFADDPRRLRATAKAIRQALLDESGNASSVGDDEDAEAEEGRTLTRLHKSKERNRALVKKKKAKVLAETGRLACEACDFDFARVYGPHGEGFIECHHTKPLHTLEAGSKTKASDLALLCANCHRMVHAKRPWLTVEGLRELLLDAEAKSG